MPDNNEEIKKVHFTKPPEIKDIKFHYSPPAQESLERAKKYMVEFSKHLSRRLNAEWPIVTPNEEGMTVKDKQWLKREISKLFTMYMADNVVDHIVIAKSDIDKMDDLIDEMDEPEITTEQAWDVIEGKYGDEVLQNNIDYVEHNGYAVIEKPVVPPQVAEWFESNKDGLADAFTFRQTTYAKKTLDERDDIDNWFANTDYVMDILVSMKNGYEIKKPEHPILKAFDEKAEEYKGYASSYRRIMEVRGAIKNVIEEEERWRKS